MLWFFDFDHVLCNTPSPENRPQHTSETPKGVTEDDPANENMVRLAWSLHYQFYVDRTDNKVFCATYRKAHTFEAVTRKWLDKQGLEDIKLLCNPCPLPEKEGLSAPEVKYNHVMKAKKMYPDIPIGGFFDDDPRVFQYLTERGIPCFLVRT